MTNQRERPLAILELLAPHAAGLPLHVVADRLGIPRSATHRLLGDLRASGYVRQDEEGGPYRLTARIASLAFTYLSANGITDIAQPVLDRLAEQAGELVRLAVIDGDRLTWVAKAQGARHGLRYDPDPDAGAEVRLSCTANGYAWLGTMEDDAALELVARQGFSAGAEAGPGAPRGVAGLLDSLKETRRRGYAVAHETYEAGTSAMAAAIRRPGSGSVCGTVSIAGPSARLTGARMEALAQVLLGAAEELAAASGASPLFAPALARVA
ncbi:IclR family transcriptional regulator [Roseomonas populi]|uniref:IclR family transcriptional regulator n=1 Tax=Roseomonas populi TaxID=3121582 RepID=A0ABT1X6Y1_9PROT|nr:IclR family transcriptional regulator [Roseomonas pecuniae]MCR0983864.1 IclR family transcriptional regulator [Roseomonas pecuniae]